ncbi:MAG: hypothetical protein Q9195_005014 [Heterodermia aff. obscurata]
MSFHNLSKLAAELSAQAKIIQDHLEAGSHAGLSLDSNAPIEFPLDLSNPEIREARAALIKSSKLIHDLTCGPRDLMMDLSVNVFNDLVQKTRKVKFDLMVLHAIVHFGIAGAIPLDGHIPFDQVAKSVGLSTDRVQRILRHAMTNNMFHEPCAGHVAHTGLSSILVRQPASKAWILHSLEDVPTAKVIQAMEKWGDSMETTETASQLQFDYLASHPGGTWWSVMENDGEGSKKGYRMQRFGEGMSWVSGGLTSKYDYLLQGFDWGSLGEATVVDVSLDLSEKAHGRLMRTYEQVGGSTGRYSIALARQFPALNFVVEDFPGVQEDFEQELPSELKERVKFLPCDIFTPQPVKAAVYFIRASLHGHSDPYAVKIIQNIVHAMTPGSRIIIAEVVLPSPGTAPNPMLRFMRSSDLQMMAVLNSKERFYEDWVSVLAKADQRLKLVSVKKTARVQSIIEVLME